MVRTKPTSKYNASTTAHSGPSQGSQILSPPPWDEFRDLPDLLKPEEVAQLLRLELQTIYNRKSKGLLPGVVLISRHGWRVRKRVLLASLVQLRSPSVE